LRRHRSDGIALPRQPLRRPPPRSRVAGDTRPKNRILAALPPDEYRRLLPYLTTIPLDAKRVLRKCDEAIKHVFFPNGGVCSIVGFVTNGAMVECATVGDEGVIGIEAFLRENATPFGETIVQVPDTDATVLPVVEFRRELARYGALHDLVSHYTEAVIALLMQQTVCNTLHDVHQRCARWLLSTHDRMHEHDFNLSHEFLALMLGVQRPTVSVVAATLQEAGSIRYSQGRVAVRNRKGLEDAACECYHVIRSRFDRLSAEPKKFGHMSSSRQPSLRSLR
jgi:CRP-like cAMP-binding protein